ncbi:MAG: hemerythrin family protein, partial [Amphritea sp.]|nr:hemerythrin family protein [Amphritea sp.]
MPVIWKSQLSTGNDLIDRDHKYLISLFNSIELSLLKPDSLQYLPIFFRELLEYTREHFEREER